MIKAKRTVYSKRTRVGQGLERGINRLEKRRNKKEPARIRGELKGQIARAWTEKVLIRTLSGAVYAIAIVACIFLDTSALALAIAGMAWLCCSEFFRMAHKAGYAPNEFIGLFVALLFPVVAQLGSVVYLTCVVVIYAMVLAAYYIITPKATIADIALSFIGPLYCSLMLSHIVLIRTAEATQPLGIVTLAVMGSVWVEDAAAYFVGCNFGRHRLAPTISPNKSVEGFFGGLVGCIAIWLIAAYLNFIPVGLPFAAFCGLCVGVISVVGDLFESRIKRSVNLKDSGNIIPGHGGLLDRNDSMLFGCTMAYLLLHIGGIL